MAALHEFESDAARVDIKLMHSEVFAFDREGQTTSTASSAAFRYQPLASREFRVLEVSPCSQLSSSVLKCHVKHVSLDGNIQLTYEAVSYVWGDPTPSAIIQLDGVTFRLPVSSEKALRRMTFPDRTRTLYLDFVCINQENMAERASQVLLMGEIYRRAQATLVHLGSETEYTARAFQNLRLLCEEVKEDLGSRTSLAELIVDAQGNDVRAEKFARTPLDEDALISLFENPWFRRVWVVQELALATRSHMFSGTQAIDMESVLHVAAWFSRHHIDHLPYNLWAAVQGAMTIWEVKNSFIQNDGIDLDEMLFYGRDRDVTDNRDKVFGMLGLLGRAKLSKPLIPDYTKSFHQVLRDSVRQCLAIAALPLDLLRHITHRHKADLYHSDLPSWVPRLDRSYNSFMDPALLGVRKGRGHWGDLELARSKIFEENESDNILTVQGCQLSHVVAVSSVFAGTATNIRKVQLDAIIQWHAEAKSLQNAYGVCHDTDLERALIADTGPYQPADCDADARGFFELLDHINCGKDVPRIDQFTDATERSTRRASEYRQSFFNAADNRRFAVFSDGSIGLVPKLAQPSDVIVTLHGTDRPFVLRLDGEEYRWIGECHVDGWMIWQEHGKDIQERLKSNLLQVCRVK